MSRARSGWPWQVGLSAIALAMACVPPPPVREVDPEVQVQAGVKPAELSLEALRFQPGTSEVAWRVGSSGARSAAVWVPDAPRPRSLIVVLHGAIIRVPGRRYDARSASRGLIDCLVSPALSDHDPLIFAPHSVDGQWWKEHDTRFVLGLVSAARQRWPELAARSVITGYSNGGIATWFFARLYPQYFAAAIPMAFNDTIVGETPLPIFAIHGDKDELFAIEGVRDAIADVKSRGTDVMLHERHRAGHMDPCAYRADLASAGRWLSEHAFPQAARAKMPPTSSHSPAR